MPPTLSFQDKVYVVLGASKLDGQFTRGFKPLHGSYLKDLFFREGGVMVFGAMRPAVKHFLRKWTLSYSPLSRAIATVIERCAKKQVAWTNARRIITAMAHQHPFRYCSFVDGPTIPVSEDTFSTNAMPSVPSEVGVFLSMKERPGPLPTPGTFRYISPKSLNRIFFLAELFAQWRAKLILSWIRAATFWGEFSRAMFAGFCSDHFPHWRLRLKQSIGMREAILT